MTGDRPEIWLAVETATPTGSVAVWRDGLAVETTLRIQGAHSQSVMPAIDQALNATEVQPHEVSAFVVGSGPGSFTGVRIGASIAKGWAMAQGTPLFAYSSLLAVAAGCGPCGPVCAMFDARRGEVYAACYDLTAGEPRELLAPGAWRIDDLLAELARLHLRPAFAGEGALVYGEAISAAFEAATLLPQHMAVPRAGSLLWLRSVAPELGRVAEPQGWEPAYVRDWKVPEEKKQR
jgi:tRNA threonylcarbamoyladenosine biosynthesis protein TsaB